MNFTLEREDRFPDGTSVSVYPRAAWQPGTTPSGGSVFTGTVSSGTIRFTDLDEGALYVAYALVGGEHRYVNFMAPYRSDLPREDGNHGVWDSASGLVAYEATVAGVNATAYGMVAVLDDETATMAEAVANSVALQEAIDDAVEKAAGGVAYLFIPAGIYWMYGTSRLPSHIRLWGAGRGTTILKVHPDWSANGPVLALKKNDSNQDILIEDAVIEGIEIDGCYDQNADYVIRLTLTQDAPFATSGTPNGGTQEVGGPDMLLASLTFNVTAGEIPAAGGRLLFAVYQGNNVGLLRYESATGTAGAVAGRVTGAVTLTNVTFVDQSNSTPIDMLASDSLVFRFYGSTTTQLVSLPGFRRVLINGCYWHHSGSQPFQAGGHPYNAGVLEKDSLLMMFSEFSHSFNSDGVDIKTSANVTAFHCEGHGSHDAAMDIRGHSVLVVGGDYSYSKGGVSISVAGSYSPGPSQGLGAAVTTATGQTVAISANSQTNWPTTWEGWLNTEKVAGTRSGSTATLTSRGLDGTVAQPWPQASSGRISFLHADVEGLHDELSLQSGADGAIIGVTANHCDGNGISVSGSGGDPARVHIAMTTTNYCRTSGISCRSTRGTTEVTISQVVCHRNGYNYDFDFVWGSGVGDGLGNGESNILLRNCATVVVQGAISTEGGGSGIEATDCGNGITVSGLTARGNAKWALDAGTGLTTFVHWDGRGDQQGNALGIYRLPSSCIVSGSAFGSPSVRFSPLKAQFTANYEREGNGDLSLPSQVVVGSPFRAEGALSVGTLGAMVTTATTSSLSRLALATFNPATRAFTVLGQTGTGSLFSPVGEELYSISGDGKWLDKGAWYVLLALHVHVANVPKIVGYLPPYVPRTATWRNPRGVWLTAQADMPASGTLLGVVTLTGVTTTTADETVVCASTANLFQGLAVVGPGIPAGTTVATVTDATHFEMSAQASTGYADVTLSSCTTILQSGNVTCASTTGLVTGMRVEGTGIQAASLITSVTDATHFVMSKGATAANTGLTLNARMEPNVYLDRAPCLVGCVTA